MKIVFIGTVDFSYKALEKLLLLKADVVGVCTKKTSSFNDDFSDLTPLCQRYSLPCKYVKSVNDADTLEWIQSLSPDIIFCFGWSSLLKKELLNLPPMGVVGFHPTKLPHNRGRHPLIWSLVLGLEQGGSTFFFMDEGADSGDILSQEEFSIAKTDDAASLYAKVIDTALKQIESFVPQLQNNTYNRVAQNHNQANYWRKRSSCDGLIDFRMNSLGIYNLVRALSKPYSGAHLLYKGEEIKVWRVAMLKTEGENIEPGKVLHSDAKSCTIKTQDGAVAILEHTFTQLPQKGEYL